MKQTLLLLAFAISHTFLSAQNLIDEINKVGAQLTALETQRKALGEKLESLKLLRITDELEKSGLPEMQAGDELVKHAAYYLDFVPRFKQARWVAHIITPDVINGVVFRTNDFRVDSAVRSGSAVEADYFFRKK